MPIDTLPITTLERQSATTLYLPDICSIAVVNDEINDKCRCCRAVQKSYTLNISSTNGLWSVNIVLKYVNNKNLNYRIANNRANITRSNLLYVRSVNHSWERLAVGNIIPQISPDRLLHPYQKHFRWFKLETQDAGSRVEFLFQIIFNGTFNTK